MHIPVEGPIGLAARRHCLRRGWPFTTSYHTRAGIYFEEKFGVPNDLVLALQRWFHNAGNGFMVQTDSLEQELRTRASSTSAAGAAASTPSCSARSRREGLLDLPRPVFTYVGRVSAEKNLDDFLVLDLPGTKLVVGDGPQLASYRERYPDVVFAGWKKGEELSRYYSASDVFVLPSRFETFGLVLLEALACGLPVAAYPVHGPIDVIGKAPVGVLDHDLRHAALRALAIPRTSVPRLRAALLLAPQCRGVRRQPDADPPCGHAAPTAERRIRGRMFLTERDLIELTEWRHRAASAPGAVGRGGGDGA